MTGSSIAAIVTHADTGYSNSTIIAVIVPVPKFALYDRPSLVDGSLSLWSHQSFFTLFANNFYIDDARDLYQPANEAHMKSHSTNLRVYMYHVEKRTTYFGLATDNAIRAVPVTDGAAPFTMLASKVLTITRDHNVGSESIGLDVIGSLLRMKVGEIVSGGTLEAVITVCGIVSKSHVVANIKLADPYISSQNSFEVSQSMYGNRIEISGKRFGMITMFPGLFQDEASEVRKEISDEEIEATLNLVDCTDFMSRSVVFSPPLPPKSGTAGLTGTTFRCTDSLIIVDVGSTASIPVGDLYAKVLNPIIDCSYPHTCQETPMKRIGSITTVLTNPVISITPNTNTLKSSAVSSRITGSNFGVEGQNIRVYLFPEHGSMNTVDVPIAAVDTYLGTVTSTSFMVKIFNLSDLNYGALMGQVAVQGVLSDVRQISTVTAVRPTISSPALFQESRETNKVTS